MAEVDYNSLSTNIDVSPHSMHLAAKGIELISTTIAEHWGTIGKTWEDLKLGWIGDSSEAADAFNVRLTGIQERLFGVPSDDGETVDKLGLLDQLRAGVLHAASNYDNAEWSVIDVWESFCSQLSQAEESSGDEPPSPSVDTKLDPIKVDYDDNPYPWHKPEES
ncbi:hypothetical protein ACFY3U_22410 [Micromonospora sp. NPDC000089]|uniref:hypothetical protein n=1 Tax=unclassified Micromonospora TaxID=2617518 RepID=UPI003693733E